VKEYPLTETLSVKQARSSDYDGIVALLSRGLIDGK
jgi:hypothetical protein